MSIEKAGVNSREDGVQDVQVRRKVVDHGA